MVHELNAYITSDGFSVQEYHKFLNTFLSLALH